LTTAHLGCDVAPNPSTHFAHSKAESTFAAR
jgi:hypothetical protein